MTLEDLRDRHRAANRFEVVCSKGNRTALRVVSPNRSWDDAVRIATELEKRYNARHPGKSDWTKRMYWARLVSKTPA